MEAEAAQGVAEGALETEGQTPDSPGQGNEPNSVEYAGSRLLLRGAFVGFGAQFVVLLVYSWVQYHRFNLGIDFVSVNQATTEIGRRNLNPYSTMLIPSSTFLDNHFAVILSRPGPQLMLVVRTALPPAGRAGRVPGRHRGS